MELVGDACSDLPGLFGEQVEDDRRPDVEYTCRDGTRLVVENARVTEVPASLFATHGVWMVRSPYHS